MKKHWLRGIVLGVSLALLLAGGVALAASLRLSFDEECIECWAGPGAPPDEYEVSLTLKGWDPLHELCVRVWGPDPAIADHHCSSPPPGDPGTGLTEPYLAFPCSGDGVLAPSLLGEEVRPALSIEDLYGEWGLEVWQTTDTGHPLDRSKWFDSARDTFLFAEDCFAAMFVPEPGSILLLGTGLAGLAGYATLRWRTRE